MTNEMNEFESSESTGNRAAEDVETTSIAALAGDDELETAAISKPDDVVVQFETFAEIGIEPAVIEAVKSIGWSTPTPVQGMCLPLTIRGSDVAGFAQTGTGKTGVFIMTVAHRLSGVEPPKRPKLDVATPEVLVLTPTRELAMQIDDDAKRVLAPLGILSVPIFGGVDLEKQAAGFKVGPRMIVATPGRIKDLFQRKLLDLSKVSIFICDEADRMFDMGFIEDVEFFLDKIPEEAQKLLFSATTNDNVKELAFEYLNKPAYISVNPEVMTPEKIEQHTIICDTSNKLRVMLGLLREHNPECSIIFTNTKMTAEWLHFKLCGNGIPADIMMGDLPQSKRIALIHRIKEGNVKALIATDVASRGLHISKVSHVYNFDVPDDPANYVHRIGRTARAGARGSAYTLVCEDYGENIRDIQDMLGTQIVLKGEWFNPEYLNIKDQTGNPFAEGAPLYRSPKDRDDKRKGASARGRDGERSRPSGPGASTNTFQGRGSDGPRRGKDDRGHTTGGGKKFDHRPQGDRSPRQHDQNRDRHGGGPRKNRNETVQARSQAQMPVVHKAERQAGVFGWVVKVFKALFGMK